MALTELPISFLSNHLRDLRYAPWTDWREFFRPTFNFGINVEDVETERDVLNQVGSYGKQINRILDALVALADLQLQRDEPLTEDQLEAIVLVKKLARDAEAATVLSELRQADVGAG